MRFRKMNQDLNRDKKIRSLQSNQMGIITSLLKKQLGAQAVIKVVIGQISVFHPQKLEVHNLIQDNILRRGGRKKNYKIQNWRHLHSSASHATTSRVRFT